MDVPAIRPDVRLADGPMQPVTCAACAAVVTVRKSSWDQTSIQWTGDALRRCRERQATTTGSDRPNRRAFPGCAALTAAVREAAVAGDLDVQSSEPLKTNPDRPEDLR